MASDGEGSASSTFISTKIRNGHAYLRLGSEGGFFGIEDDQVDVRVVWELSEAAQTFAAARDFRVSPTPKSISIRNASTPRDGASVLEGNAGHGAIRDVSDRRLRNVTFDGSFVDAKKGNLLAFEDGAGDGLLLIQVIDVLRLDADTVVFFEYRHVRLLDPTGTVETKENERPLLDAEGRPLLDAEGRQILAVVASTPAKSMPNSGVFDLYAPYTPDQTTDAARDVKARLDDLLEDTDFSGFFDEDWGTNNPPPTILASKEARREVYDALDVIGKLRTSDANNRDALMRAANIVARAGRAIANWILPKVDKLVDAFIGELGKNLGNPARLAIAWTIVSGELFRLAAMVIDKLS